MFVFKKLFTFFKASLFWLTLFQEEEKSEVLQLHEKMKRENEMRKRESAELRSLIESQKQLLDLAGRDLVSML